jgi:hypothetical protein
MKFDYLKKIKRFRRLIVCVLTISCAKMVDWQLYGFLRRRFIKIVGMLYGSFDLIAKLLIPRFKVN